MNRTTAVTLTLSLVLLGILGMIAFALTLADSMAYRMADSYDMVEYLRQEGKVAIVVEAPHVVCTVKRQGDDKSLVYAEYKNSYAIVLTQVNPLEKVTLSIDCYGKVLTESITILIPGEFYYIDYDSSARAVASFPIDVYKNWKRFAPAVQYYKEFIKK